MGNLDSRWESEPSQEERRYAYLASQMGRSRPQGPGLATILVGLGAGLLGGAAVAGCWALGFIFTRRDAATQVVGKLLADGPEVISQVSGVVRSVTDLVGTVSGHVDRFAAQREDAARKHRLMELDHDLHMQKERSRAEAEAVKTAGAIAVAETVASGRQSIAEIQLEKERVRAGVLPAAVNGAVPGVAAAGGKRVVKVKRGTASDHVDPRTEQEIRDSLKERDSLGDV